MFAATTSSVATALRVTLRRSSAPRSATKSGATRVTCASSNKNSNTAASNTFLGRSRSSHRSGAVFVSPAGGRRGSASTRNSATAIQGPDASTSEDYSGDFDSERNGPAAASGESNNPVMTFTTEELAQRDAKAFSDFKSQEAKRRMMRKPWKEMKFKEQFEYAFVRFSLTVSGGFVLLGVLASLILSALLFSMGLREVIFDAFTAWTHYNAVELVASAVGALDRFLLGMVCLVFGLG